MIILVQGLYKDEVLEKCIEQSKKFNIQFINAESCNTFDDFIILLEKYPHALIYNTWVDLAIKEKDKCSLQRDEMETLNEYVKSRGGFAYYLTSTPEKLLSKFDKEDVQNYDFLMVQMKMHMPIIAYDCDKDIVPVDVKIT